MYQLKSAIKRSVGRSAALTGAVFMLGGLIAGALPTVVHADALNPLTERTLTLTSSSPGFHYKDGSGNSPSNPNANGGNFAPPGSGPNGKQTGEAFSFKVSTDSSGSPGIPLKAFTFQYCTTAAGKCQAPGNATPGTDVDDTLGKSNLNANYTSPVQNTDFEIWVGGVKDTSGEWNMSVANKEDSTTTHTTMNNFITLTNTTNSAPIQPTSGTQIKIVFKASATNYITNPGADAFFVKINDYSADGSTPSDIDPTDPTAKIVDGGVTVANVMTDSIQIQTKVLETMSFSVGTVQPDTQTVPTGDKHGPCDKIATNDDINLGDPNAEYSLNPAYTWDAHSYWRLSSNSSGGATVYYSGATLNNTVGDDINAIGTTKAVSHQGMEQFGLAYDATADTTDNSGADNGTHGEGFDTTLAADQLKTPDQQQGYKTPTLLPLVAATDYSDGAGHINTDNTVGHVSDGASGTAKFAFDANSLTSAVAFATYNADVIQCSTGKMRYIANISPNTPAGVYTTKINYLAAPQY